jgi:hypothetical protein
VNRLAVIEDWQSGPDSCHSRRITELSRSFHGLGEAFTREVKEAWTTAYLLLAGVMKEAAASHAEAA